MSPRRELPHTPGKCKKCGEPSGKFKQCAACRERNKIAQDKFYGRVYGPKICEGEGCREEIPPLSHFCQKCKKARKLVLDRAYKAANYVAVQAIKPHRPAKPRTLSDKEIAAKEAEQARLDAAALARDREWQRKYYAGMGLASVPGQPLASDVVRPPLEVWRQLEAAYTPLRENEREFHLPLRADISY